MKAKKTMASSADIGNGPDLIIQLPDPLLCSIISLLPTEEALATSILSRRWKSLWMSLHQLDFDPMRSIDPYLLEADGQIELLKDEVLRRFEGFDKTLFSQVSTLSVCRISHFNRNWSLVPLYKWIKYLTEKKKVEELSLFCSNWSRYSKDFLSSNQQQILEFPGSTFRCQTLRVLELHGHVLKDESPFKGCVNLQTLKLDTVELSHDTLVKIIFSCMFLDNLCLSSCRGLSDVEIQDQNLKSLEITGMQIDKFLLRAKRLKTLVLDKVSFSNLTGNNAFLSQNLKVICPDLGVLRSYCKWNSEFLVRWIGILSHNSKFEDYDLKFDSSRRFENMRVLCTTLNLNDLRDTILLAYIFRVCIGLSEIHIQNKVEKEDQERITVELPYDQNAYWEKKELWDSITYHLRIVRIWDFTGKELEILLVTHLIRYATMLEKVEIQCADGCSKKQAAATMQLLSEPRASIKVSVILMPGPRYMEDEVGDHDFEDWMSTLE